MRSGSSPRTGAVRTLIGAVVALLLAAHVAACTPRPDVADAAAAGFVGAFARNSAADAAGFTTAPADAEKALAAAWAGLQAESMEARVDSVETDGDAASASVTYSWRLPKERSWEYAAKLRLVKVDGAWKLHWSESTIHPRLGAHQLLELRGMPARRAVVLDSAGAEVLRPGIVTRVLWDDTDVRDPGRVASAISRAVDFGADGPRAPGAREIFEGARGTGGAYSVTVLDEDRARAARPKLEALPGVTLNDESAMVRTDPGFAPDLMPRIEKAVSADLEGESGWRVVAMTRDRVDIDVVAEKAPESAPAVRVALDRNVQNAAQKAVDTRDDKAMMVVIQPSSGRVLAVAQTRKADEDGQVALMGQYPPGSTFKIVTAGAALDREIVDGDSTVPCPGTMAIGSRMVSNYNGFSLGDVPLHRAFARSCNTTFAKLAADMEADSLTAAAASFGIGVDYTIDGIETTTGSVPPADDLSTRVEDGFGQGRVLVSPFGMALVASTAATGRTPVPYLVEGHDTGVEDAGDPLPAEVFDRLRPMMREVVTSGTGAAIAGRGEIFAKTGEAEIAGGSHAWFVGYRGDLAFATLVVLGGGSEHAVAVTNRFFAELPDGY